MKPSSHCLDHIRDFEGLRLRAYLCPAKKATIGYGSTGPDIKIGMTWSLDQAKARLQHDVETFANKVTKIAGECTQGQYDALVAFAYNVGIGTPRTATSDGSGLWGSTLLRLHLKGDHEGAALQFLRWNKAGGKVLGGLTRRRTAEMLIYRS